MTTIAAVIANPQELAIPRFDSRHRHPDDAFEAVVRANRGDWFTGPCPQGGDPEGAYSDYSATIVRRDRPLGEVWLRMYHNNDEHAE